jgi:hypothetical protein
MGGTCTSLIRVSPRVHPHASPPWEARASRSCACLPGCIRTPPLHDRRISPPWEARASRSYARLPWHHRTRIIHGRRVDHPGQAGPSPVAGPSIVPDGLAVHAAAARDPSRMRPSTSRPRRPSHAPATNRTPPIPCRSPPTRRSIAREASPHAPSTSPASRLGAEFGTTVHPTTVAAGHLRRDLALSRSTPARCRR